MPTKKQQLSPEQELEILFPEESYVTQSGQKITVAPFPFGFWRTAIELYNKHTDLILGAMEGKDISEGLLADDGAVFEDIAELALGALPELSREDLDKLPGHEAIILFFKVIKVNADFFGKALAEGLGVVSGKLSPALPEADTDGVK